MKTIIKSISILAFGGATLFVSSCKKEGCMDQNAINFNYDAEKDNGSCEYDQGNPVQLSVNHMYGTDAMSLDSVYEDAQGTKYQFTRCDFYLSNFMFMDMGMSMKGMTDTLFLIDVNTSALEMGRIDLAGHVQMMNAVIGLDSLMTYTVDPSTMPSGHPLAPQVPSMYWSWNSGYIYFAVEGTYDSNGDQVIDENDTNFEMHLGTHNFSVDESFMIHTDLEANQTLSLNLNLDYAQLFNGFDLANDNTTHVMDNMPLANALKANLANFLSVN